MPAEDNSAPQPGDESRPVWMGRVVPDGFWKDRANRKRYMDWLGRRLGCKRTADWYKVTKADFDRNGGGGLLANYYNGSPHAALKEYKPGYDWKEWLARSCPQGFWAQEKNRLRYLAWLEKKLGFKTMEDWYRVTQKSFIDNHGATLLHAYYGGSVINAVREYMPEYDWKEWLFRATPQGFWREPANRRRYMEWLGERLGFRAPTDWANLTKAHFQKNGGAGLLATCYGDSPQRALEEFMPGHNWERLRRVAFEKRRAAMWERRRREKAAAAARES